MAAGRATVAEQDSGKRVKFSRPGDREELQARTLARQAVSGAPACTACAGAVMPCPACRAAAGSVPADGVHRSVALPAPVARALSGAGEALPGPTRAHFERRLGADLGGVRLHRDAGADLAARSVGANAFTLGNRIAFAAGAYGPEAPNGLERLGHELVHTLQPGARETLRRDEPRDGGSAGGPGAAPATPLVPDPVAGMVPRPAPDASAAPSPAGMNDEQRLARIAEILTNWVVGPLDELELEALWGAFKDRLPQIAGDHPGLWNLSWSRGARVASLPAAAHFLNEFEERARDTVRRLLTDSENRINAERIRYGIREIRTESIERRMTPTGDRGPGGMPIRAEEDVTVVSRSYAMADSPESTGLQAAAGELVTKRNEVERRVQAMRVRQMAHERTVRQPTGDRGPGGLPIMEDVTVVTDRAAHAAIDQEMREAESEYDGLRVRMEGRHPILATYAGADGRAGLRRLAESGGTPDSAAALYGVIADRLANIERVRRELVPGGGVVVWKLPEILAMTRSEMGIADDSLRAFMVAAKVDQYEADHQLQQAAVGAIALGLGLLAAVPTGGSSLVAAGTAVAAVGGAGVSAYVVYAGVQNYLLESAATGTDSDRARAISQEDPSLFWLAVDIVGALVDAAAAVTAVRTAMRTAAAAYRELAPLVHTAARTGESANEAMDALRTAAGRHGVPSAVLERIVARTRRLREGADEVAVAVARVEHAELEAGRALAKDGHFLAELPGTGGHGLKLTASGQITRCSAPCLFLRGLFAEQLARNSDLEAKLVGLETRARAAAAANDTGEGGRILAEVRDLEGRLRDLAPPVVPKAEAGMGGRMRAVTNADDLEYVRMHRPDPRRPPAAVLDSALSPEQRQLRQADWEDYCAYYQGRVEQLEHQLGVGGSGIESPIDWDSYRQFLGSESHIQRGWGFQQGVTGSMTDPSVADAFLTEGDIALSRSARPTAAPGQVVRPDQFMVDLEQLRLMQDGRLTSTALDVTAASNKSRRFDQLLRDGTQAELRAVEQTIGRDITELFDKYSGVLHVRREGALMGRQVHIRELILVYDLERVPAPFREAVRSIASRLGSERAARSGFTFWIAFQ